MTSPQWVQVDELPRSIDGFLAMRDRIATSPQGGAATMAMALLLYAENEELGRQCLAAAVDRKRLVASPRGHRNWQLGARDMQLVQTQIKAQPYLPRSYVKNAIPENGYQLPIPPFEFEFSHNPHSGDPDSGVYKVFIVCSGASSPRPVTVKRNNRGIWKAYEWSSLIVGVRQPAGAINDDL